MLRPATPRDSDALVALENRCFSGDRLTRRSFRHLLTRGHAALLVEQRGEALCGYVLVLFSNGASMARLYSIATDPDCQRQGVARRLVEAAEAAVLENGYASLRLEIRRDNPASQALFRNLGYKPFQVVPDYYEDHADALRFEKFLRPRPALALVKVPYYRQSLDFTCGPAALMMAMKALRSSIVLERRLELRLWREATTIFMTSGHGGCSPYGLALAAHRRGFDAEVYVESDAVFLGESVRSAEKREVMRLVHEEMLDECREAGLAVHHCTLSVDRLEQQFEIGGIPLVLISSYQIYRQRAPHWVVVTGFDRHCVYTHDPFVDDERGETVTDSINLPIARRDFQRMARYGKRLQRAVVLIRRRPRRRADRNAPR